MENAGEMVVSGSDLPMAAAAMRRLNRAIAGHRVPADDLRELARVANELGPGRRSVNR